jgi:hypothetical protein
VWVIDMDNKKMGFGMGLLFVFLFALLTALYNMLFASMKLGTAWVSFTEAFVIGTVLVLVAMLLAKLFKIKNMLVFDGMLTLLIGIVYGIMSSSAMIFVTGMFVTIIAIVGAYLILQVKAIKKIHY